MFISYQISRGCISLSIFFFFGGSAVNPFPSHQLTTTSKTMACVRNDSFGFLSGRTRISEYTITTELQGSVYRKGFVGARNPALTRRLTAAKARDTRPDPGRPPARGTERDTWPIPIFDVISIVF